ncbi:DUF3108 domain-containing protein [Limibacter armeniacum]|uniref:DUF3108 domain-containing protein n=1 Tax=Limibacter armeniacum TaxID=466084 RepID=UPI002FE681D6
MKKIIIRFTQFLGLLVLLSAFATSNGDFKYRSIPNNDFERGETLTYIAGYAFVDAGQAVVKVDKDLHSMNGRTCYKVDVDAKSIGLFSWTTKIKDKWQSYVDTAAIIPMRFHRDIAENNYRLVETTDFDHINGKAKVTWYKKNKKDEKNANYSIPTYAQDIISGYYYLRTLDYDNMQEGDTVKIDAFFEDKSYDFNLVYLGKEKIYTNFGRIDSFVMSPIMPDNKLFYGQHPIKFWVSNDANRVPLKINAELVVGAVEVNLVKHKGLKTKLGR